MNQKLAELKRVVTETIDGMRGQLEELALRIHAHPETKFEEERAADWLCEAAQAAGFQVERPLAGLSTAFRASFRGGEGPRVAFLAEYDALPELGHACGHNLIGAASLGAALGIALGLREFPGTVELIGTPGEEGGGGKVILAQAGVFNGLAAGMLFHPSSRTILWKYALARRKLLIEFFGKAAHASGSPDKGINALDAVLQTFQLHQRPAPTPPGRCAHPWGHHRWGGGPQHRARPRGGIVLRPGLGRRLLRPGAGAGDGLRRGRPWPPGQRRTWKCRAPTGPRVLTCPWPRRSRRIWRAWGGSSTRWTRKSGWAPPTWGT